MDSSHPIERSDGSVWSMASGKPIGRGDELVDQTDGFPIIVRRLKSSITRKIRLNLDSGPEQEGAFYCIFEWSLEQKWTLKSPQISVEYLGLPGWRAGEV
uniref:Uncharacterized protein n=1 Tax=Knipowitschia caucasica TaxID=637954 RepID=A0AAV2MSF9_KNICA